MLSVWWLSEGWGKARYLALFAVVCDNLTQGEYWVAVHCQDLSSKGHLVVLWSFHTNGVWHFPGTRPAVGRVMLPPYHPLVLPFHLEPLKCWNHTENWLFLFKLQDANRRCHHVNVKHLNEKQDTWESWAETACAQKDSLICYWRGDSGNLALPETSERRGARGSTQKSDGNWGPWLPEINGRSLGVSPCSCLL